MRVDGGTEPRNLGVHVRHALVHHVGELATIHVKKQNLLGEHACFTRHGVALLKRHFAVSHVRRVHVLGGHAVKHCRLIRHSAANHHAKPAADRNALHRRGDLPAFHLLHKAVVLVRLVPNLLDQRAPARLGAELQALLHGRLRLIRAAKRQNKSEEEDVIVFRKKTVRPVCRQLALDQARELGDLARVLLEQVRDVVRAGLAFALVG